MKKSQRITLTVVAAMGIAGAQPPATQSASVNCDEARRAAKANGTALPNGCVGNVHHGGFGSIAAFMHGHGAS